MIRFCKLLPLAVVALVAAALIGAPTQAKAGFEITIHTSALTKVVADGGAGDLDAATPGSIIATYSGGGWTVTVTTSLSKPAIPNTPSFAQMDLAVTAVHGAGAVPLTITMTDTGFVVLPSGGAFLTLNSTTAGLAPSTGKTAFQSWIDIKTPGAGNEMYGGSSLNPAPTGTVVTTDLQGPFTGPGAFSSDVSKHFGTTDPNPFSMTGQLVLTPGSASAGGVFSSDSRTTVAAPAPAGLVLVIAGLPVLGVGAWIRRRRNAVAV